MPTCINHTLRMKDVRKGVRAIVTPMVLFAFLLQIFIVQTHVHFPTVEAAGISHAASGAPSVALHQTKKTSDTNAAHCPWCQAVLASGNYLPPVAVPVALPVAFGSLDRIIQHAHIAASRFSHTWQSRAPPA